jgi:hypothetical protein
MAANKTSLLHPADSTGSTLRQQVDPFKIKTRKKSLTYVRVL